MTTPHIAVGKNIINVVTMLGIVLMTSLVGLIALGVVDGDAGVRSTLTHISETVLGVFVGLAAGRLTSTNGRSSTTPPTPPPSTPSAASTPPPTPTPTPPTR